MSRFIPQTVILAALLFFGSCELLQPPPTQEKQAAAVPEINPPGGEFRSAQTVTITSATPDAEIRYTLDGTAPGAGSLLYSGPVQISTPGTLKAVAMKPGFNTSPEASAAFTFMETQTLDYFGEVRKISPDPSLSASGGAEDWYKDQVFYHIWVSSFHDSDGNGVGDIPGITAKLNYLKDLGVTSLWLSPFFSSASPNSNLHGYDVTDYYQVDPRLGTMEDVKTLLTQAHSKGIKIIFDFVPNHVSDDHPWFRDSAAGKNGKRDWFVWKDSVPASGWTHVSGNGSGFHAYGDKYYYGVFWSGMPDLNYRNPEVREEMASVMTYWLNLGFDGMRVDAVKYLFEDDATGANKDLPETLEFFQNLRSEILDQYKSLDYPKFMVAENWTSDRDSLKSYINHEGKAGFQATLDFDMGHGIADVIFQQPDAVSHAQEYYGGFIKPLEAEGGWTFSFLNNHDNYRSRPASAFGTVHRVRLAQALQAAGWGTQVLYYGNEVMMPGYNIGNDITMRQKFPWAAVTEAQEDSNSVLSWQRTLNRLKLDRISLRRGDLQFLDAPAGLTAVLRKTGDEATLMVVNLGGSSYDEFTLALGSGVPGTSLSTLVGSGEDSRLGGTVTVKNFSPFAIRVYALESGALGKLRGDFTDPPSDSTLYVVIKDYADADITVNFYNEDQLLLSETDTYYFENGGYQVAEYVLPVDKADGYYRIIKKGTSPWDSGMIKFHLTVTGVAQELNSWPYLNTGSADQWYVRGSFNTWTSSAMEPVPGEPGQFRFRMTAAQASSKGVGFKFNSSADAKVWDYFFGFLDVQYDDSRGDSPAGLNYGWSDGQNYNIYFQGDGTSSYDIFFEQRKGEACRIWIKKVL